MTKSAPEQLAEKLEVSFTNISLLQQALTHPSLGSITAKDFRPVSYERLEFLGDTVLALVISEYLLSQFPEEKEGALAKRRSSLVSGSTLSTIAKAIGIGEHLVMTGGEKAGGGMENAANLENALEAVIGAIYLDQGLERARGFIHRYWIPYSSEMREPPSDPKTALQEWAQKSGKPIPRYTTVTSIGPSHAPEFTIEVEVQGFSPISATGSSKRIAERQAASKMLAEIALRNDKL